MTIAFSCPGCGKQFKVSENMAGRKAKCSACATVIQVPAASEQRIAPAPGVRKSARTPAAPAADVGDEEVRPSRVRKTPKKKSSKMMLFALLGLGGVLSMCFCCVGGFVGLGYYGVVDPFDLNYRIAGGPPPEYKYLPDNCQMVAVVNLEEILESDAYKQAKKEVPEMEKSINDDKQFGISASNIVRIVAGGNFEGKEGGDGVVVLRTKSAVKASDIESKKAPTKYKQIKEGDYTIYHADGQFGADAFCVADDKTVLIGKKDTLVKVLRRDKKPEFSEGLKNAMKQVSFKKSVALAVDVKSLQSKMPKSNPGEPFDFNDFVGKAEGVGVQIEMGSDIDMTVTVLCKDDKSAEDLRKKIEGGLSWVKDLKGIDKDTKELIEGVKVSNSGSKCTASLRCKVDPLTKTMKKSKGPFLPF
jgi:hypothetical protein